MENNNSRRDFIRKAALLSGAVIIGGKSVLNAAANNNNVAGNILPASTGEEFTGEDEQPLVFTQDPLPYDYDALEPYIDRMTMQIHYSKHHAAYISNLNKALAENKVTKGTLESILRTISKYPTAIRNNAGGHWNHKMFWEWMAPNTGDTYSGKIAGAINAQYGSLDKFKEAFTDVAMKRFGSGWTWLVKNGTKLEIVSTANQDNPLMDLAEIKGHPVLGLDVWEHAYYLKHQNVRKDYITDWFNVVNWNKVNQMFV